MASIFCIPLCFPLPSLLFSPLSFPPTRGFKSSATADLILKRQKRFKPNATKRKKLAGKKGWIKLPIFFSYQTVQQYLTVQMYIE